MNKVLQQSSLTFALGIVTALAVPFPAMAQTTTATTPAATPTKAKPEVKSQSASSNTATAPGNHDTVEYKDPEDMTTRYRPGNNKTSAIPVTGNASASPTVPAAAAATPADAKKHVSNIKYGDRQATVPALDAASKDAAKSKTAPPPSPNNGKPATASDQDSKRANKVDSFTVKQ